MALWLQGRRRKRSVGHPTVPVAPGNLQVSLNGGVLVVLQWDDRSSDEQGFHVYRQVDGGGGFELVLTFGAGTTYAEDGDVISGHQYQYYVTAFNAVGESGLSNMVEVTLP
jgi:fibronectin type 3 domain-containing protein